MKMLIHGADSSHNVHDIRTDAAGRPYVNLRGAESPVWKYSNLNNVNETTLWDPTSGYKWVLTDMIVSTNNLACITFRDGTGGSTFLEFWLPANTVTSFHFMTPIQSSAANNNLTGQTSSMTSYITLIGYEI